MPCLCLVMYYIGKYNIFRFLDQISIYYLWLRLQIPHIGNALDGMLYICSISMYITTFDYSSEPHFLSSFTPSAFHIISPIQDEFLFDCYSMHLLVIGLVTDATNTWFLIIEFNEVFASEGGIGKIIDYIGKLFIVVFNRAEKNEDYIAHF
ncbi:hypothetical protein ACJX0J_016494, partial [Zea mays]